MWGASLRWSSSLYCSKRSTWNSYQMIIEMTRPTLEKARFETKTAQKKNEFTQTIIPCSSIFDDFWVFWFLFVSWFNSWVSRNSVSIIFSSSGSLKAIFNFKMKSIQTSKLVGMYQLISRAKVVLTLDDLYNRGFIPIPQGLQGPQTFRPGSN